MSISQVTRPELFEARQHLSQFVRRQAAAAASELGFGWVGVAEAPSTYSALRAAFDHSQQAGAPLPISNLYCGDTVFLQPSDNVDFRFWHDTSHCRYGLDFSLPDEWRLTLRHLADLEAAGYGRDTDEYRLLRLDLLGQLILLGVAGRFPRNQRRFTLSCAQLGLDAGVLAELGRVS